MFTTILCFSFFSTDTVMVYFMNFLCLCHGWWAVLLILLLLPCKTWTSPEESYLDTPPELLLRGFLRPTLIPPPPMNLSLTVSHHDTHKGNTLADVTLRFVWVNFSEILFCRQSWVTANKLSFIRLCHNWTKLVVRTWKKWWVTHISCSEDRLTDITHDTRKTNKEPQFFTRGWIDTWHLPLCVSVLSSVFQDFRIVSVPPQLRIPNICVALCLVTLMICYDRITWLNIMQT